MYMKVCEHLSKNMWRPRSFISTQSHWSSGSTVCFRRSIPGMHPHLQWNRVLLAMSRYISDPDVIRDPWSLATIGPLCCNPVTTLVSRPLLRLLLGEIGFVYPVMSMVVIGPSLPILRQRRWSLLYDVYWLNLMMVIVNRWQVSYNGYLNGIEIPEHSSGSEIAQYWSNNNWITHNKKRLMIMGQ